MLLPAGSLPAARDVIQPAALTVDLNLLSCFESDESEYYLP
jgi:hypothetical protein